MTPDYGTLLQSGFAALARGAPADALRIAETARARQPGEGNAHFLTAAALYRLGDPARARPHAEAASRALGGHPDIVNLHAVICRDLGEGETARALFDAGLAAHPGHAGLRFNRARLHLSHARPADAEADLAVVIGQQPEHRAAHSLMAGLALDRGDLEAARRHGEAALSLAPHDLNAQRVLARLELEEGKTAQARARLEAALAASREGPGNRALALGVLGEAREGEGDFRGAFAAFEAANSGLAEAHRALETLPGPYAQATAERLAAILSDPPAARAGPGPEALAGSGPAPVFLVGFPRSGTTLAEQMLDAHPRLRTSDEAPLLSPLIAAAGGAEPDWTRVRGWSVEERRALRARYWQGAGGEPEAGVRLVDKLPLNLIWLGLIAEIFPDAHVVLALRDPRDAVWSAFVQRFGLNPAMYRLLRLDTAAAYYDAAMRAGQAARAACPQLQVAELRYEDLLADREGEMTRILEFLGLGWDPALDRWREHAAGKAISTPSARQVRRPLYTSSVGKWRRYAFAMEPVLPVLAPWVKRWGYGD